MYIKKYWGNFIGGSDDSLNLVAFLEDQKKEEIPLSEIFAKIGLDKQNWDFRQTVEYLEFTHSDGVEMDFHFAIDVVTDLAAILLECSISGSVNLQDLDEYNTPSRRIRITATPEEHDAMNKALADFAQNPLEYDLSEMMDDEEIQEMARDVEALRKELYEAAGRNRDYHVKAEDMKNLLPDWENATGCIATNRITVEGCKVGYCYREKADGDWDSGWRFTAGDESDKYMDDPKLLGHLVIETDIGSGLSSNPDNNFFQIILGIFIREPITFEDVTTIGIGTILKGKLQCFTRPKKLVASICLATTTSRPCGTWTSGTSSLTTWPATATMPSSWRISTPIPPW